MKTFHDAAVVSFVAAEGRVEVGVERVSNHDGLGPEQENGVLVVEGVSMLTENKVPVVAPTFSFDDDQILELDVRGSCLRLLVEWEDYSLRVTQVAEYEICGEKFSWVPEGSC